jgi:hypothetical protein
MTPEEVMDRMREDRLAVGKAKRAAMDAERDTAAIQAQNVETYRSLLNGMGDGSVAKLLGEIAERNPHLTPNEREILRSGSFRMFRSGGPALHRPLRPINGGGK